MRLRKFWWWAALVPAIPLLAVVVIFVSIPRAVNYLDKDVETYAKVPDVPTDELIGYLYGAREERVDVDAFPGLKQHVLRDLSVLTLRPNGFCPVVRCEGNVFIITFKWVNTVTGYVIPSPQFSSFRKKISRQIRFGTLKNGVRTFDLDLERDP